MVAAVGMWQTGPGGLALNLIASALWKVGADGLAKMFAKPTVDQVVEKLLLHNGLMVPSKSVSTWFAKPEALAVLGRIEPRAFSPGPVANMNPDDVNALDEAALSFRIHAGHRLSWTDGQGVNALQLVVTCILASDIGVQHELSQLRTEHKLDAGFIQALDDLAVVGEEVFRTGQTADRIEADVQQLLQQMNGVQQHLDGIRLPFRLRNNRPRISRFFTGREDAIAQVAEAAASSSRISYVVLQGMGGVGKSTIAAEYCDRYDDRFDIIWWIRAGGDLRVGDATADAIRTTPTSLIDDLADLGLHLRAAATDDEPPSRARKALAALASIEQRWLIVYDSANHSEAISAWLPSQGNGQVIVTSRSPEITEVGLTIKVGCFDKLTGAKLLQARCTGRNELAAADDQAPDAQALSSYLGGHPLALAQAGAYVASSSRHRFGTYLRALQEDLAGELSRAPRPDGYPEPAHRAFLTSIAAAEDSNPLAGRLLLALAFIEPDLSFPFQLLEAFADGDFLKAGPGEIESAISALAAYAVIAEDQGHPIVHRLVQAAALERRPGYACAAQSWLCGFLPGILEAPRHEQTLHIAHLLQPHALRMVSGPAPAVERWKVLNANAQATLLRGDPRAAVAFFEQALLLVEVPDDCDPNTLDARTNLAASYRQAGRLQDAIAIQEPLLAQYERCIGPSAADTLSAHLNLANSYLDARRTADAIKAYEHVSEARLKTFGPTDDRTIAARSSLGVAYSQDGRSRKAIDILEPIIRLDQLSDQRTAIAAGSALAFSYEAVGRAIDGMRLKEKIYAQSAERFGSEHLTTLSVALNLAMSYAHNQRLDEALMLQMLSAERLENVLGTDHHKVLLASANLATILAAAGQAHAARQLLESVVLRSQSNPNVASTDLDAWTVALDQSQLF